MEDHDLDIRVDDEGVWISEPDCGEYSCDYFHPEGHEWVVGSREHGREAALHNIDRLSKALAEARTIAETWCVEHDWEEIREEADRSLSFMGVSPNEVTASVRVYRKCRACDLRPSYVFKREEACRETLQKLEGVSVCYRPKKHEGDHRGAFFKGWVLRQPTDDDRHPPVT